MTSFQFSDFDIDLNKNSFIGDVAIKTDRDAVRQSIVNIILTRPGEKPFNRDFGVGIHDLLFENWTPFLQATTERKIKSAIVRLEPRAKVTSVTISNNLIDNNLFSLTVSFSIFTGIKSNPIKDSLQIGLIKVR